MSRKSMVGVGVVALMAGSLVSGCAILDDLVNNSPSDKVVQGVVSYCSQSYVNRPTIYKVASAELTRVGYAVKISCSPIGN